MRVAVLGMGVMGAGMAASLLREGLEVSVWNRTRAKAEPLAEQGATVADTAVEAASGADVVMTMLFDTDSVLEVMDDVCPTMAADAVWVQTATIGLDGTAAAAALAAKHGVAFVDSPVLGTKGPAEQGKLVMLAGGDPALRERVAPAFDAVGARTIWVGDEPGRGTALKLVCNAWVGTLNAAIGQSVALAGQLGLDPNLFLDAIKGGGTDAPYAQIKGPAMISGDYPLQFELDGVRKDFGLIRDAEIGSGTATTLTAAVLAVYDSASELGHGGDDMAAVVTAFRPSEPDQAS